MNGHPSTSQGTTKELDIHLFASYEIGHPSIQVEFAWLFLDIHRIEPTDWWVSNLAGDLSGVSKWVSSLVGVEFVGVQLGLSWSACSHSARAV